MYIDHRYISGKEVTFNELKNYSITNPIVLDTIHNTLNRINKNIKTNNKNFN
jgi:hypothetical protein